jgi:hypothetical protein
MLIFGKVGNSFARKLSSVRVGSGSITDGWRRVGNRSMDRALPVASVISRLRQRHRRRRHGRALCHHVNATLSPLAENGGKIFALDASEEANNLR